MGESAPRVQHIFIFLFIFREDRKTCSTLELNPFSRSDRKRAQLNGLHLTTNDLLLLFNPLTPRMRPWVIQSFLTFDSMDRTQKCDHSLESCWAVLYWGAVNFPQLVILANLSIFELGTVSNERFNLCEQFDVVRARTNVWRKRHGFVKKRCQRSRCTGKEIFNW